MSNPVGKVDFWSKKVKKSIFGSKMTKNVEKFDFLSTMSKYLIFGQKCRKSQSLAKNVRQVEFWLKVDFSS